MLAVAYNPTYPTIIDVEGLNIDFSVSATGTIGGKINITGVGSLVDVWMGTGSMSTIAYIRWLQSYVSRNNMFYRFLPDPDDNIIYSLGGIVTGSSIIGQSISPAGLPLVESTSSIYYSSGANLIRKGLGGQTQYDYVVSGTSANAGEFFLSVKEGMLYGLAGGFGSSDTTHMKLNSYDFSNGLISTVYTGTAQKNEHWRSNTVVGSYGSEKFVALSSVTGTSYIARVFDANNSDLLLLNNFLLPLGLEPAKGAHTAEIAVTNSPQIYGNKVIYPYIESWLAPPSYPYVPPWRTYRPGVVVYDADTGASASVGIIDDPLNPWINEVWTTFYIRETGIDYENGWYYFITMKYDYIPPAMNFDVVDIILYKVTVSMSPTITLIRHIDLDDYLKFVTGKTKLYGLHYKGNTIEEMSSGLVVGSVPVGMVPLPYTSYPYETPQVFAPHLDETDQRMWFVNTATGSTLYGASIVGEDDKIITLTNGTFVDNPINSMNLVNRGVVFTSSSKIGLAQG